MDNTKSEYSSNIKIKILLPVLTVLTCIVIISLAGIYNFSKRSNKEDMLKRETRNPCAPPKFLVFYNRSSGVRH